MKSLKKQKKKNLCNLGLVSTQREGSVSSTIPFPGFGGYFHGGLRQWGKLSRGFHWSGGRGLSTEAAFTAGKLVECLFFGVSDYLAINLV